jgi:hypothetical protein
MTNTEVSEIPKKKGQLGIWLTILLGLIMAIGFGLMIYDLLLGS